MVLKYNSIIVIGRATRDAEMRYTQDGTPVTRLGIAYNHTTRNSDGSWNDEPTFFNVVCFRETAERANTSVKKGTIVLVEGRMQMRKFTGQDGTERQNWEIVANTVRVDSSGQGQGQMVSETEEVEMPAPAPTPMRAAPAQRSGGTRGNRAPAPPTEDPDDLPF